MALMMIDYDNFSLCYLADIFFTSYVVAREPRNGRFFAKIEVNRRISSQNGLPGGQLSAEQNRNSETLARPNKSKNSHFCDFWRSAWRLHFCEFGGERVKYSSVGDNCSRSFRKTSSSHLQVHNIY